MQFSDSFNLFFEKKFVYGNGRRSPEGGRGGEVAGQKPKHAAETKEQPTLQDLKDRIKHVKSEVDNIKDENKKKELNKKFNDVEGKMKLIEKGNKEQKQRFIKYTYNKIGKAMTKHGIKFREIKTSTKPKTKSVAKPAAKSSEGPGKTPKSGKEVVRQKPPTIQDLKDRVKYARDNLHKIKDPKEREKLRKKLNETEIVIKKIETEGDLIFGNKKDKQQAITDTYNKIGEKIKKVGIGTKPGAKPPAKPAETLKGPKRKPARYTRLEIKEGRTAKMLVRIFDKINTEGRTGFNDIKGLLNREFKKMKIPTDRVGFTKRIDLPKGYSIAKLKLPKDKEGLPSVAVFNGNKLICYMNVGKNSKGKDVNRWQHAEDIGSHGRIDSTDRQALRIAQIIKCNALLPRAMHQIIEAPPGKINFKNPEAAKNFRLALKGMARFSGRNVNKFHAKFAMANVFFTRSANHEHGEFKIKLNIGGLQKTLFYNTSSNRLGIATFDNKSRRTSKYGSETIGTWTKEKSGKFDEQQKTLKNAAEKRTRRLDTLRAKEGKLAVMRDLISTDAHSKGVVKDMQADSFTVQASKEYIKNTNIAKLLNLKAVKGKLVYITIKTTRRGKTITKKGLYVPGQKWAYNLDKRERQRSSRLTFKNKDKISIEYKNPLPAKQLRKIVTSRDKGVLKFERMRTYSQLRGYEAKFRKYILMGGTAKNLAKFAKNKQLKKALDDHKPNAANKFGASKLLRIGIEDKFKNEKKFTDKLALQSIVVETKMLDKAIAAQKNTNKEKALDVPIEQMQYEEAEEKYNVTKAKCMRMNVRLKKYKRTVNSRLKLEPLSKYKSDYYKPKDILKRGALSKNTDLIKEMGYKKMTELVNTEIKVLQQGLDRTEADITFTLLDKKVKEFNKLKGKLSDSDLRLLQKFKGKVEGYDPKKIATPPNGNWNKIMIRRAGAKKFNEIMQVEIQVLTNAIANIKGKKKPKRRRRRRRRRKTNPKANLKVNPKKKTIEPELGGRG